MCHAPLYSWMNVRRVFSLASLMSFMVFLCLLVSTITGDAHRYWLNTPVGTFGPFPASFEAALAILLIASAVPPILWTTIKIRRELIASTRWNDDLCRSCSYNLTGNTSGVCPECGNSVPKRKSGKA